jgi:UDP-N-acetylglucosamine acyltransferase
VSIHAGTAQDRGVTTVGDGNWLLAYVHIAHDCAVGNRTTFSNNAQLAGHVVIGDYVTMGGFTGVHQFCRVGAHAMVAAGAIVLQDVPPYVTVAGYPAKPAGTNNEGLRRRGFTTADIATVRRAYKTLYREGLPLEDAKAALANAAASAPVLQPLADFLAHSARGIVR